jgi:hypothetical protein
MSSTSSGNSYGYSTNQSTSQSTSTPEVMQSPQSQFLLSLSGKLQGYADQTYAQYDKTFTPMQADLISRAQQELSPQYQEAMGGKAIAGAAQLSNSNRNTALQNLNAFGVGDPSNVGRRYSLDANTLNAAGATEAGAANEAMLGARNEGRTDQNQAISNEQQAKAMAVQQSTAAMSLKLPPVANTTQSTSQSTGNSQNSSSNSSRSTSPQPQQNQGNQGNNSGNSGNGGGTTWPGMGTGGGGAMGGMGDTSGTDPLSAGQGGAGTDGNPAMGAVYSDPNSYNNTGGDYYNPGATDTGGVYDPNASYNSYDSGSGWGDSSGGDSSGYSGFAAGGAVGGALDVRQGGAAPQAASPSAGMKPDDIDAKVTAHEFVIPKDVAIWKGHEYWYKQMESARKTRLEYQSGTHKPAGSK